MKSPQIYKTRRPQTQKRVPYPMPEVPANLQTQQQFKDECDMNRIVKNAARGIAPRYLARGTPQYGDFYNVPNLPEAYELIERAESAFMNLPAGLRLELGNDPANINKLTVEQIKRFKLDAESALHPLSQPAPAPATAGQAEPVPTTEGGPKKSAKADS